VLISYNFRYFKAMVVAILDVQGQQYPLFVADIADTADLNNLDTADLDDLVLLRIQLLAESCLHKCQTPLIILPLLF
jgi:hypothetical protein